LFIYSARSCTLKSDIGVKMVKKVLHKNLILLIVAVAQFMVVLDTSIVNVALPSIAKALHFAGEADLQWIVTAYTLAFGGFLLLGGRAADLYGRKRQFVFATALFGFVSLLTGLATTPLMLDLMRAAQGLIAAFMSPAALSIVLTTFKEGKERAKALSVWGAVAAAGGAAGVLLGGVLTQYLDWRWNFFVNVPVGLAVAWAAHRYVPESKADLEHQHLDLPGATLVTSGLMLLVYALTKAPEYGWTNHKSIWLFGAAVALLAAFIWNEKRSKQPLMPLHIFGVRNVGSANLTSLFNVAAIFSMFFFVTLYVQQILGWSPLKSGLGFLPITFVIGGVATSMQHVIPRIGYKKPLIVAPWLIAAGLFWLSHISVNGSYWTNIFPGLVLTAAGMGVSFIAITMAATAGVSQNESGLASGLLNTSQQIGGSLGLAILSGIATSGAAHYAKTHAAAMNAAAQKAASGDPSALAAAKQAGHELMAQSTVVGFRHALLWAAGFALLGSLSAALLIREKKGEKLDAEVVHAG
jgi:EmrB/QacA subfamily drug resistance transporter